MGDDVAADCPKALEDVLSVSNASQPTWRALVIAQSIVGIVQEIKIEGREADDPPEKITKATGSIQRSCGGGKTDVAFGS